MFSLVENVFIRRIYGVRRLLFAGTLALIGPAVATAQAPAATYLALGDSVPFGYNPTLPLGDLAGYFGYPYFVSKALSLNLANASCVGESSASFLQVGAPDLGCKAWRDAGLGMWVTYSSLTESQMQFAISYLKANPATRLVTITIGGNDLGILLENCEAQYTSADAQMDCEIAGLPQVYAEYAKNLLEIYTNIRVTAHYTGPLIAANYFSIDYNDAFITGALGTLDAIMLGLTSAFGGKVADAFTAFQQASVPGGGYPCAPNVGLSFVQTTSPLTCNPHPTVKGHQLYAQIILDLLK
jgi:lysophospholipase L1-like esterase